jgi:hypothetical protein
MQGGTIMSFGRISASLFSILLLAGVVVMSSSTASAQWNNRSYDGYPNWGGSTDLRQSALNSGYNDGMKAGADDRNRNRRSNFNDFKDYRNASKGYSSRFGDRELYSRYYRVGFEHGYAEYFPNNANNGGWNNNNNGGWNNNNNNNNNNGGSYNNGSWRRDNGTWTNGGGRRGRNWGQYGTYGGSANFRQTALNAGYNEGIKQGRKDRSRGPRNLDDFSSYRNANTDYRSQNGDLGLYQRYYREGFENGYYDGLNGY